MQQRRGRLMWNASGLGMDSYCYPIAPRRRLTANCTEAEGIRHAAALHYEIPINSSTIFHVVSTDSRDCFVLSGRWEGVAALVLEWWALGL